MRHLTPLAYIDAIARAGSIRKAAETLSINSTALNRRVLALEEELGTPIFERLARGVRLTTAGELFLAHVRNQVSDVEKLKSQIADLSGKRRGHVSIACSQALLPYFLPEQISRYRTEHPAVTFGVSVRDRAAAEQALSDHTADIALVFEPVRMREVQLIAAIRQPLHAVMSRDHPLAGRNPLRLRDCTAYPIALPTAPYGVRHLLEGALIHSSISLDTVLESDSFEFLRCYPRYERLVTFQIPIGLPDGRGDALDDATLVSAPIDPRDVPEGTLYLCQLRGRTLPVAAAKFAGQLEKALNDRYV